MPHWRAYATSASSVTARARSNKFFPLLTFYKQDGASPHPALHYCQTKKSEIINKPNQQQINNKSAINPHKNHSIKHKTPPNLLHLSQKSRTFAAILQQYILCDSYVIPMIFVCYSTNHTDTTPYQQNSIRLTQTTYQYGRSQTTNSVRRDSRSN